MVYNGLFNQVDLAIKPDGSINNDRLASIVELRKAGALCDDINILLDVCRQDEQGNYNKDDIKDICDLTSFVIDGEKVCSLAPEIRKSDEAKQTNNESQTIDEARNHYGINRPHRTDRKKANYLINKRLWRSFFYERNQIKK